MHSTGFRTSDPRRMRWVKVATEMSSLVSMLFRTFLNPLKFLMEIFNILYVCASVFVSCNLTYDWQEATDNNIGIHTYSTYPTMHPLAYTHHHIHSLINPSAQKTITFNTKFKQVINSELSILMITLSSQ